MWLGSTVGICRDSNENIGGGRREEGWEHATIFEEEQVKLAERESERQKPKSENGRTKRWLIG
jgi:hypothetical protein